MTKKDFYKEATKDMVVGLEEIKMNMELENKQTSKKRKHRMSRVAVAAIAGMLTVGTVGVSAYAIHHWSSGVKARFQVSSEDTAGLEEAGVVDFPDENGATKSVTKNGVTISAAQTVVDNYYAYLVLKVQGYQVEEGETPGFDNINCTLDGKTVNYCSSFYDDTIDNGSGRAIMADGSEIPTGKDGSLVSTYMQKDGTLEYHILLYTDGTKGYFFNKTARVELGDLGVYGKKDNVNVEKEGTWSFEWKLGGNSDSKMKKVDATLGNTGAVVSECEVSPISLRAMIDTSNMKTEKLPDGTAYPKLSGVKLKDGTLLTCITDGGIEFNKMDGKWEVIYSISRIIDVDEVESFLFVKSSWEEGETCSEDNFYEVSIVD